MSNIRELHEELAKIATQARAKLDEIAPVSTKVVSGTNAVLFKTSAKRALVL